MEQKFPEPTMGRPTPTLPEGIRAAFADAGAVRRLRRGGTLFRAGTTPAGLHLVEEGQLRVVRGGARRVVLHYERPGGMLGETALFGGTGYPATAIAAEPTRCRLLPAAQVWRLLADDPEVAAFFLRRLALRLGEVIGRLDEVSHRSVAARLARHLLERPGAESGRVVTLGMTQVEVAQELGTVREVVVRELRRLVASGAIAATGRGRYQVADDAALRRVAAGASAPPPAGTPGRFEG